MKQRPALRHSILQLCLLGILCLLIAPANGRMRKPHHRKVSKMNVQWLTAAENVGSCKGGLFLPGVDSFRFTQEVHVLAVEITSPAEIYVGTHAHPRDYKFCTLFLAKEKCVKAKKGAGCYCDYAGHAMEGKDKYLVTVHLPLTLKMANDTIYMWVKPEAHPADMVTLFTKPIPNMIGGKPVISVTLNGKNYGYACPTIKRAGTYTVKFCVQNLQNPMLTMHFDPKHVYIFKNNKPCGVKTLYFGKNVLGKKYFFLYKDTCKRHGTMVCDYPKAGAPTVRGTEGLLVILSLGYLLTSNI